MKLKTLIFILSFIIFASTDLLAQKITAKKYLSIRTSVANLRIGPSPAHPIAFVYEKKNMPVEVIDEFEVWRKVKDYQGDTGWLHLSHGAVGMVRLWSNTMLGNRQRQGYTVVRLTPRTALKYRGTRRAR